MMQRFFENATAVLSWLMAGLLGTAMCLFIGYVMLRGIPVLGLELIFGQVSPLQAVLGRARVFDGLYPAIVGTVGLVLISISLAAPVGICAGIYLSEYAGLKMQRLFGLFFDILAGIPSIVIGLFGFSAAVVLHKHFSTQVGPCLLISAMALAFLVLPYLIRSTQNALRSLPRQTRRTALTLGATTIQNIVYVLAPRALPGIMSGVILAIGRCAEDTAVIMLTGVVATAGVPSSLLAPFEALPFYIYYVSSQYMDQAELMRGYGACLILLGVCAALFLLAFLIKKGVAYQTLYRD